jgi:hypothetical protein
MANVLRDPPKEIKSKKSTGGSMFSAMDKFLNLDQLFETGVPLEYVPKVLFATVLVIVYIANGHYAERNARKVEKMKQEVEDLRADYITIKSEYMFQSKQSEVAKKAESMGIYESETPPTLIVNSE